MQDADRNEAALARPDEQPPPEMLPPAPLAVPAEGPTNGEAPSESDELSLKQIIQAVGKSGYFNDIRTASQAVVRILAGKELGIPPIAALKGIYIVEAGGKTTVTISASMMAALVRRSDRYDYKVEELTNAGCAIRFRQRLDGEWQDCGLSTFTMEDAKRAGIARPRSPWEHYPRNMLFARAMSNGCRWYCSDIFAGPVLAIEEANDLRVSVQGE
jgi:hypothetical protein